MAEVVVTEEKTVLERLDTCLRRGQHYEAKKLLEQHRGDNPGLVDEAAKWYLRMAGLPCPDACEHCIRACELMPLGLSETVRASLLATLISNGFQGHACHVAESLGRQLMLDEVRALVSRYVSGSLQSDSTETALRSIAWDVGGELLDIWVATKLTAMHERWRDLGLMK